MNFLLVERYSIPTSAHLETFKNISLTLDNKWQMREQIINAVKIDIENQGYRVATVFDDPKDKKLREIGLVPMSSFGPMQITPYCNRVSSFIKRRFITSSQKEVYFFSD